MFQDKVYIFGWNKNPYIQSKGGDNMANAILAAVLSFLIPGLGQAYAGDVKKGVIFFVIAVVLAIISFFTAFLLSIISLIFAIYAAYDAYKMVQI